MCGSSSGTTASGIPAGAIDERFVREGMEPVTNHVKPTFKLLKREKKDGRTRRSCEPQPKLQYQRLLESLDIPEATKAKLRTEQVALYPFELKKSIEAKLKKFFTTLGNLNRESTKT